MGSCRTTPKVHAVNTLVAIHSLLPISVLYYKEAINECALLLPPLPWPAGFTTLSTPFHAKPYEPVSSIFQYHMEDNVKGGEKCWLKLIGVKCLASSYCYFKATNSNCKAKIAFNLVIDTPTATSFPSCNFCIFLPQLLMCTCLLASLSHRTIMFQCVDPLPSGFSH